MWSFRIRYDIGAALEDFKKDKGCLGVPQREIIVVRSMLRCTTVSDSLWKNKI
jgi:hypothetical protein